VIVLAAVHALRFDAVLLRLAVGAILGVVIGFERQWRGRPAGVQTTGLVAAGAALFCVAAPALGESSGDPMRVVAAVVQGVGFLAGGVILKEGLNVTGLNTAATVWSTAAVGALSGVGLMREATAGALTILILNLFFLPFVDAIDRRFMQKHPSQELRKQT
jgi:putative Mg2+ transporter-C (MgtC) family protein